MAFSSSTVAVGSSFGTRSVVPSPSTAVWGLLLSVDMLVMIWSECVVRCVKEVGRFTLSKGWLGGWKVGRFGWLSFQHRKVENLPK